MMSEQLTLDIQLNLEATLSHFNWAGNEVLHHQLTRMLCDSDSERILYLWGASGNGKSYLLQSCCHDFDAGSSIYIPLNQFKEYDPVCLEGLDSHQLICVDDIDCIAKDSAWEEALFHLYNRVKDNSQSKLIISGHYSPTTSPMGLPDLRSRLAWGIVFQIQDLSDEEKIKTLGRYAESRGIDLSPSVCRYLLAHYSRSMNELLAYLANLDHASLATKRKITIPFVKKHLPI